MGPNKQYRKVWPCLVLCTFRTPVNMIPILYENPVNFLGNYRHLTVKKSCDVVSPLNHMFQIHTEHQN
jgi:hypothetical protein